MGSADNESITHSCKSSTTHSLFVARHSLFAVCCRLIATCCWRIVMRCGLPIVQPSQEVGGFGPRHYRRRCHIIAAVVFIVMFIHRY